MERTAAQIGTSTILIESTDDGLGSGDPGDDDFGTTETGTVVEDAYGQLKKVLQNVSADLGGVLGASDPGLSSVSVEFAFSFTSGANAWVLKAEGQGSVKATLTWNFDRS